MSMQSDFTLDEAARDIEALSTEYSWLVDHGHAERVAELFTDDATLTAGGPTITGIADIRKHLQDRAQQRHIRSRHVVSNIRLVTESPDRVRGSVVMTVYRSTTESAAAQTVVVGDVEDVYARGADGRWRIAERRLIPVFVQDQS